VGHVDVHACVWWENLTETIWRPRHR